MSNDYISKINGAYQIRGTRVSLDSIVYAYLNELSPAEIVARFPAVTLEQIAGAIAFYHAHQAEIDAYLRDGEAEFERLQEQARETNAELYKKLTTFKEQQAGSLK